MNEKEFEDYKQEAMGSTKLAAFIVICAICVTMAGIISVCFYLANHHG